MALAVIASPLARTARLRRGASVGHGLLMRKRRSGQGPDRRRRRMEADVRLSSRTLAWVAGVALLADARVASGGGKGDGSGIRQLQRDWRDMFQRTNPCPVNGKKVGYCPGYVIGYVVLPKHGGKYDSSNMQWMTYAEAEKSGQDLRW